MWNLVCFLWQLKLLFYFRYRLQRLAKVILSFRIEGRKEFGYCLFVFRYYYLCIIFCRKIGFFFGIVSFVFIVKVNLQKGFIEFFMQEFFLILGDVGAGGGGYWYRMGQRILWVDVVVVVMGCFSFEIGICFLVETWRFF